jgi:hypothetical protein
MNRFCIVGRRRAARIIPLAVALMIASVLIPLRTARAISVDPGDYIAAQPGTNVLLQYLQYSWYDGINMEGVGNLPAHLESEVGIFRAIHYANFFGFTIDPQILIPFGTLHNVQINGQSLNSSSGAGDPTLGATLWLVNRPDTSTYFGITPFITFPLGHYQRFDAINLGNNRYQGDLQLALHTAFGSDGLAKKFALAVLGDVIFFGANTQSAIQSHAGLTQATLTQSTGYQLQSWLTYTTDSGTALSVGYNATMGGQQSLAGSPNGLRTEEGQVRFEVQKYVSKRWQLAGELTHDVHVVGGFRQDIGINARVLYLVE